ncbi:uncharacterized protein OCT59_013034 [Rhizophagus irregularis]|uniref:uncharacterized protein n=1 Tax=Rhizophagus irregularis TaxID=588596 RepID=UPI0033246DC6|nr:hypothetical protein OCT59_013034 [Rhizophagus irregularis]
MDETPKNLWENTDLSKYLFHVTIPTIDSTIESENVDERVVYIGDLEKRKQAYGICGECKEPGTGNKWCQPCNAKRFKDNFKNWTSENKDIDEFIQQSQLNAVHYNKYLEWIPFEKFQNITYIAEGGFGMCQPTNIKQTVKEEGIYGVLPYMAPEVLRGQQYTKAADIYSFGIIMNEFLSEEIPFNDIPHDEFLAIKICKGLRPTISKDIPKLLADLIIKCWDPEIKNRPITKELYQLLTRWDGEKYNSETEIYFQIEECDKIRKEKFKNRSSEDKPKSFKIHPQAIYTSRLLNFKNLSKPVNSLDLSSFQFSSDTSYTTQSTSANPISECLDVQLSELELNEICQDNEYNIE